MHVFLIRKQSYLCTYFFTSTYPIVCRYGSDKRKLGDSGKQGGGNDRMPRNVRHGQDWRVLEADHFVPFDEWRKTVWRTPAQHSADHRKDADPSLKQLEGENLIVRKAEAVVPPVVYYSLSDSGKRLKKVLHAMAEWVIAESKLNDIPLSKELESFPGTVEMWESRRSVSE